jgi:hypothetical protein
MDCAGVKVGTSHEFSKAKGKTSHLHSLCPAFFHRRSWPRDGALAQVRVGPPSGGATGPPVVTQQAPPVGAQPAPQWWRNRPPHWWRNRPPSGGATGPPSGGAIVWIHAKRLHRLHSRFSGNRIQLVGPGLRSCIGCNHSMLATMTGATGPRPTLIPGKE